MGFFGKPNFEKLKQKMAIASLGKLLTDSDPIIRSESAKTLLELLVSLEETVSKYRAEYNTILSQFMNLNQNNPEITEVLLQFLNENLKSWGSFHKLIRERTITLVSYATLCSGGLDRIIEMQRNLASNIKWSGTSCEHKQHGFHASLSAAIIKFAADKEFSLAKLMPILPYAIVFYDAVPNEAEKLKKIINESNPLKVTGDIYNSIKAALEKLPDSIGGNRNFIVYSVGGAKSSPGYMLLAKLNVN